MWTKDDELVGTRVLIETSYGEEETATVLAVSTKTGFLKVRTDEDDEILIGNQWEPLED